MSLHPLKKQTVSLILCHRYTATVGFFTSLEYARSTRINEEAKCSEKSRGLGKLLERLAKVNLFPDPENWGYMDSPSLNNPNVKYSRKNRTERVESVQKNRNMYFGTHITKKGPISGGTQNLSPQFKLKHLQNTFLIILSHILNDA
jgi:hypothetical protein